MLTEHNETVYQTQERALINPKRRTRPDQSNGGWYVTSRWKIGRWLHV